MAEIKVLSSIDKTSKFGKPYKALEVFVDDETRKVNVFSNAPDFANIRQGATINGTMSKNGAYWDITFEGQNSAPRASGGFKTAQAKEVIDYKQTGIAKSQDNKEHSIKVASTFRMAVDCALAELKDETILDTLEEGIAKWRKYFWENWDIDEKEFNPF